MSTLSHARSDWLAWRRTGIGASDVAAILGLSRWATPYQVWLSKVVELPEDDAEHLAWGHLLEDAICDEVGRRLHTHVAHRQEQRSHRDHPHHLATLDGIAKRVPRTVVECKTTGDRRAWDEVPIVYHCQAQWQMHVTGLDRAVIAVLHAGQRLDLHDVDRDDDDIARMVTAVDRFWHDHVLTGVPPEPLAADLPYLNGWTPAEPGKRLDADDLLEALTAQTVAAVEAAKQAAEYADGLKARLAAAIGDATELVGREGQLLATWRPTSVLDHDAVTTARPDLVAEHTHPRTDWTAVREALKSGARDYLTAGPRRLYLKGES